MIIIDSYTIFIKTSINLVELSTSDIVFMETFFSTFLEEIIQIGRNNIHLNKQLSVLDCAIKKYVVCVRKSMKLLAIIILMGLKNSHSIFLSFNQSSIIAHSSFTYSSFIHPSFISFSPFIHLSFISLSILNHHSLLTPPLYLYIS